MGRRSKGSGEEEETESWESREPTPQRRPPRPNRALAASATTRSTNPSVSFRLAGAEQEEKGKRVVQ